MRQTWLGFLALVLLSACSASSTAAVATATRIPQNETGVAAELPDDAETLTLSPVPSARPTQTPLPTLMIEQPDESVRELLVDNSGCQLPCWWGIIPGETSWDSARNFLAPLAARIEAGGTGEITEDGTTYTATNYSVYYQITGIQAESRTVFSLVDDGINLITVDPQGTELSYTLQNILSSYGVPDDVLIQTFSSSPLGYLPFRLALFYGDQRILANYELAAERENDQLIACPETVGPKLWLWSDERPYKLSDLEELITGPDSFPLAPIEGVTAFDRDSFYENFVDPENPGCIQTPANLWP